MKKEFFLRKGRLFSRKLSIFLEQVFRKLYRISKTKKLKANNNAQENYASGVFRWRGDQDQLGQFSHIDKRFLVFLVPI